MDSRKCSDSNTGMIAEVVSGWSMQMEWGNKGGY